MNELTKYKEQLEALIETIEAYEEKPMKKTSLQIRKLSNEIGKDGVHLRAHLIELDKKGK